jgi:hypothetical protein
MTISDEIEAFIRQHRGDGQLVGDATEPLPNGYQLITCPCGVMFVRWVTPDDAAIDLAALHRRSSVIRGGGSLEVGRTDPPTANPPCKPA